MEKSKRLIEWQKLYNEVRYSNRNDSQHSDLTPLKHQSEQNEEETFIGFQKRLFAFCIDSLILSILVLEIANFYLLFLLISLYYAGMTASPLRGTLGKMSIGAVVVDGDGNQITFIRSLLRFYAYFISSALCFLGYVMIFFDFQHKSLHDFLCKTYVVNRDVIDSNSSELVE
ncbi:RDD family protein [Aquibacillus kalidii]|uniref:RDD family protein n=1 Tax=Aquibacillus kalidii TaxID=2762597 RepID=UPI001645EE0F|nr:RDD family protein [Aquibacillus kalidii]